MNQPDFHKKHGKDWYLLVNTEMWKDAMEVTRREFMKSGHSNQDLMLMGAAIAAKQQGADQALNFLETVLIADPVNPLPEADYRSEEMGRSGEGDIV